MVVLDELAEAPPDDDAAPDDAALDTAASRLAENALAEACADAGFGRVEAVAATGRHYALVAAKDGGRAAFVDRREATKLPDTHLKTWESKSKS